MPGRRTREADTRGLQCRRSCDAESQCRRSAHGTDRCVRRTGWAVLATKELIAPEELAGFTELVHGDEQYADEYKFIK